MKPDESNVSGLFSQQVVQYSIPHYQRPQSWNITDQWEPLWADIEAKANDWLSGIEPKQHYLGAIVLAKRPKFGVRGIDRNLVIDGQQRLSTLQYLLKALAFICREQGYADGEASLHAELFNGNESMMDQADIQRHKLWPTFRDREHHKRVMMSTTMAEVRGAFPDRFTKSGLLYANGNHPKPLHACWFFYLQMREWLRELPEEQRPLEGPEALRQAITKSLQLIVLWLEPQDDPQVIFECLNGRGAPLRSTDLIKNFIFMSAESPAGSAQVTELTEESDLFKRWSRFDSPRWLADVSQGRLKKPRLEWLVYYSLQAESGDDVDSSKIYQAYQRWAGPGGAKVSANGQVSTLEAHGDTLERFLNADQSSPVGRFGYVAQALDVTIISSLVLAISRNAPNESHDEMFKALASYLVRREVCGLTKKAYNQIFFSVLRELKKSGFSLGVLVDALSGKSGLSSSWPSDQTFSEAIHKRPLDGSLNLARLLLAEVANEISRRPGAETRWVADWTTLHLEHLLPRSWYEHWPLPDGTRVTEQEAGRLGLLAPDAPQFELGAIVARREHLKHTLGNLTVLDGKLNIQLQNHDWTVKREDIRHATQLRMNFDLVAKVAWTEVDIEQRSAEISKMLVSIWPGPTSFFGAEE